MNIRKGDIVQVIRMPMVQGRVIQFAFFKDCTQHYVSFRWGRRKFPMWTRAHELRVVRRRR